MSGWIILFLVLAGFALYSMIVVGSRADKRLDDQIDIRSNKTDPNLRAINTYFFENNMFSFRKFSDYILCIRETMDINEIAQSIMELDLLLKCSGDLQDRFISILTYSEAIIGINYKEFEAIKEGIRENKFKGTYQDLVYIYLSTVFYLKYLLAFKKGKFDSYNE